MSADDNDTVLNGTGKAANVKQQNVTIVLSGRSYYHLQCSISDAKDNKLVTHRLASNMYRYTSFKNNFEFGRCGFQISYHGTGLVSHIT